MQCFDLKKLSRFLSCSSYLCELWSSIWPYIQCCNPCSSNDVWIVKKVSGQSLYENTFNPPCSCWDSKCLVIVIIKDNRWTVKTITFTVCSGAFTPITWSSSAHGNSIVIVNLQISLFLLVHVGLKAEPQLKLNLKTTLAVVCCPFICFILLMCELWCSIKGSHAHSQYLRDTNWWKYQKQGQKLSTKYQIFRFNLKYFPEYWDQ